jgi:hypothetical protein
MDERRARLSIYGNFAAFLLDIFHIKHSGQRIDGALMLPDIRKLDGLRNHQEVIDGKSQSGVRPGQHR